MPTYRNDTRGTILIKNKAGVPIPVRPKETFETYKSITMPGVTLLDATVEDGLIDPTQ